MTTPPRERLQCGIDPVLANRYHLLTRLGEGGMAEVWLAHDARLDTRRAVKILDPQLRKNAKIRERFDAEARAMARLAHPHVVTVHDVGDDGERAYIVMELVHGGSLAEKVRTRGPLPPRLACETLAAVLDALDTAHALGVVHRDVKPHNVLLTADGVPKITDFGIAQIDAGKQSLTRTGSVMGTIPYMAPEQKLDSKAVGPAADVYGVGATLYHLVSGAEPYDLYVDQVRKQVLGKIYTEIAEIVDRATRYDAAERYRSAGEMRGALLGAIPRLPYPPVGMTAWMGSLPNTAIAARSASDLTPVAATPRNDPGDPAGDPAEGPSKRGGTETVMVPEPEPAADPLAPTQLPVPVGPDTVIHGAATLTGTTTSVEMEVPEVGPRRAAPIAALAGVALFGAGTVAIGVVAWLGGWFSGAPAPRYSALPDPVPVAAPAVPPAPVPAVPAVPVAPGPAVAPAPGPMPGPRPVPGRPRPAPPPEPAPAPAPSPEPAPTPDPVPAPPPAPAAPTGELLVQSVPPGLDVLVDGARVGVTPLKHPVPAGSHRVEIVGPGGVRKTLKTTVVEGAAARAGCWDFSGTTPAPCKI